MDRPVIQNISIDDLRYSLQFREDDQHALDLISEVLLEVEVHYWEASDDDYYEVYNDSMAEILSVVKAYIRGYFELSDVMSILNDEYPWMVWPWDYNYLKVGF